VGKVEGIVLNEFFCILVWFFCFLFSMAWGGLMRLELSRVCWVEMGVWSRELC
jgi:hypothetical protein